MNVDLVVETIRQLVNRSRFAEGPIQVGSYRFDNAVVVWPIEPPQTDWSRPPSTIGGSVYVFDMDTQKTST
jgi:hypothetical protein